MIELDIPGRGGLRLQHMVTDVNGTLAVDGQLIDGVAKGLLGLCDRLQIYLLAADTHGRQELLDRQLGLQAVRIPGGGEAQGKGNLRSRSGGRSDRRPGTGGERCRHVA